MSAVIWQREHCITPWKTYQLYLTYIQEVFVGGMSATNSTLEQTFQNNCINKNDIGLLIRMSVKLSNVFLHNNSVL